MTRKQVIKSLESILNEPDKEKQRSLINSLVLSVPPTDMGISDEMIHFLDEARAEFLAQKETG